MTAPDVWYLRGEGGGINPMSPPFGEGIAARIRSGALLRVNEDGSPYTPPVEPLAVVQDETSTPVAVVVDAAAADDAPAAAAATLAEQRADKELAEQATTLAPLPMPDRGARKGEWTKYAASTGQITLSAAEDMTVRELIERFGG